MNAGHANVLSRFFSGLAEATFQTRLGVADPPLIDYISGLLVRFVRFEAIQSIRNLAGRRLSQVADMLAEAEQRVGPAAREVHQHIGDFTLFWTGVYPEALQHIRGPGHKDHLVNYWAQGKRAYRIASTIQSDDRRSAPGEVLERLSEQFELCAYGLREIRREWERRDGDDQTPRPYLIN